MAYLAPAPSQVDRRGYWGCSLAPRADHWRGGSRTRAAPTSPAEQRRDAGEEGVGPADQWAAGRTGPPANRSPAAGFGGDLADHRSPPALGLKLTVGHI